MKLRTVYLVLCFAGLVFPYWQFVPWLAANGLHLRFFMQQLFANGIGGFFAMDVFISALALLVFMRGEGDRVPAAGRWFCVGALLLVGVSLALPLFLYMRETSLKELTPGRKANA